MAANNSRTITVNIRAVTDQLTSGLRQASGATRTWSTETQGSIAQVEQATERMSRLWRSMLEAFLGYEAIKGLLGIAKGADDAAEQLDVAARVAKNFGHALDPKAMEAWLQSFAKSAQGGGYAVDAMRASVQQFASVGLDAAQIQRAIADTADLAAAKNMDFASASNIVRYALTGHVDMLTRYGIISREAAKNIHTVEQAMEALEHATSGAAAQRSERLAGALGRLGSAASLLRDKVGDALIPLFDAIAKALTALADVASDIPAPVLQVAAVIGMVATAAVAAVLVLPAIWKGLQIVGEAFNLLMLPVRGIVSLFVGPLIAAFAEVITWLGGLTTALASGTLAEWAFAAPVPALVLACAALVAGIVLVVNNLGTFQKAWSNSLDVMGRAFHDWVSTVGKGFMELGEAMAKLFNAQNVAQFKDAFDTLKKSWKDINVTVEPGQYGLGAAFKKDFSANLKWAETAAKNAFSKIFGFLNLKLPNLKIPHEAFSGVIPGKGGGDAGGKAAENAMKNFDEATKNWLAGFAAKVDAAKARVDVSTEKLADFDVNHPANEPMSAADQAQRQSLVNDQLTAERSQRDALLQQQRAEIVASNEYLKVAAAISVHLKNHDQLVRQALDAAREHAKAARDIYLNYLRAGTELDTIIQKERDRRASEISNQAQTQVDATEQGLASAKIANDQQVQAINQAIAMAQVGGNAGVAFSGPPADENVRHAQQEVEKAQHTGGGAHSTVAQDHLRVALAQLAVAAANAEAAEKADIVAIRQHAYDVLKSVDNEKLLTAAKMEEAQAALDVTKANDALVVAQQKMQLDIAQQWNTLMNGLIEKTGMPGLSGAGSSTAPLSFNPMAIVFAAVEQTQSFGNIMTTVTQIVQTFSQALDALKPIIDALLDVIRAVVNVFIFMYNAVARLLDLFGMQIQQLQYLNSAIGNLVPLIEIWHEIPTLNELAAGKLNSPLSTQPQGVQSVGGPGQGQNGLMKVVELLTGILVAVIVERVIATGSLQTALQQTMHLIGINIATNRVANQAPVLSAQQKAAITLAANQSTTTANIIGAKAAASSLLTNTWLQQIELTLQQILMATQMNAAGGAGGFGSALGIIDQIFHFAAPGGGGAQVMQGPGGGGPMAQLQQAAQRFTDGLRVAVRSVSSISAAFDDLGVRMSRFANAMDSATTRAAAFAGPAHIGAIGTALSLDTSRRIAVSGNSIDRVPGI